VRRAAPFLLLLLSAGCESSQFDGECQTDADCPLGAACRADGLCACRTDEACQANEFCNRQGQCQTRAGCRANTECAAADFCDLATGNCIPRTNCASDVHCVHGTVCPRGGSSCINGCYDDGDCPLFSVCEKTGTASIGSCLTGRCGDKTFCDYGDRCSGGMCSADPNPNHCAVCNNQPTDCGSNRNYCLVNPNFTPGNPNNGSQYFCGVECRAQEDCPSGYNCGSVILLTQDQCTRNEECGGGGRQCLIGEGDLRGFCTCANDNDCTIDQAPPTCAGSCGGLGVVPCTNNNECATSCVRSCQWPQGRACSQDSECEPLPLCAPIGPGGGNACITNLAPCNTNDDCLCNGGRCVGTGRPCTSGQECRLSCQGGGCLLGAACAPVEGLSCNDVR
jgi:hypothetical protein